MSVAKSAHFAKRTKSTREKSVFDFSLQIVMEKLFNLSAQIDGQKVVFKLPSNLDLDKPFEVLLNNRSMASSAYSVEGYVITLDYDPVEIYNLYVRGELLTGYMVCLEELLKEVKRLGRFEKLDTMVCPLTDDEITDAIYNAVDDINMYPPETSFTLESIYRSSDTRWKRCVILRAAANALDNLLFQWTADGIDVTIGEFTVNNKTSEYASLRDSLNGKFSELLEKLKIASQNFVKSRVYDAAGGTSSGGSWLYRRYNVSRPG